MSSDKLQMPPPERPPQQLLPQGKVMQHVPQHSLQGGGAFSADRGFSPHEGAELAASPETGQHGYCRQEKDSSGEQQRPV